MMTPTAPAFCAFTTLVKKAQSPRWTSAIAPESAAALRDEQARPSSRNWVTSRTGAVRGGLGFGPSLNSALIRFPAASTAEKKICELVEAPTVIADGAVPGV